MVNNSTNINKTTSSYLKSFNGKNTMMAVDIQVLAGLGQAQKCGWVKPINLIPPSPSW